MSEQTTVPITMKEQLYELLAEHGDTLNYAAAKKEINGLKDHYFNKLKRTWIAVRSQLHRLFATHGPQLTYNKAMKQEMEDAISQACFDKLKKDWTAMQPTTTNNGENTSARPPDRIPTLETAPLTKPLAAASATEEAAPLTIPVITPASDGGNVKLAAVMIDDILAVKALITGIGKPTLLRLIEVL